jgi:CRP-like cAMP-binding protein
MRKGRTRAVGVHGEAPTGYRIVQTMTSPRSGAAAEQGKPIADLLEGLSPLHVRYARSELICREGTFVAGLQLITQGLVVETCGETAQRVVGRVAELLGGGDIIGLEAVLPIPEDLYLSSYHSLTEVQLLFVDRTALDEALANDPYLAATLIGALSIRHFRLRNALLRSALSPTARLRSALLDAASISGVAAAEEKPVSLPPEIDLRVLGDLARLSPTQVRRGIQELPGVQARDGQITLSFEDVLAWQPASDPGETLEGLLNDR